MIERKSVPFTVDRETGALTSKGLLSSRSYSFTVRVNDTAGHTDEMDVVVSYLVIPSK